MAWICRQELSEINSSRKLILIYPPGTDFASKSKTMYVPTFFIRYYHQVYNRKFVILFSIMAHCLTICLTEGYWLSFFFRSPTNQNTRLSSEKSGQSKLLLLPYFSGSKRRGTAWLRFLRPYTHQKSRHSIFGGELQSCPEHARLVTPISREPPPPLHGHVLHVVRSTSI